MSALEAIQPQDLVNMPHKRQSLLSSAQTKAVVTPTKNFPAEVAPLQSTSSKLPIAPDCKLTDEVNNAYNFNVMSNLIGLIPNSTVRQLIGYVPPPDIVILQQLPLTTTKKILSTTADGKPQNTAPGNPQNKNTTEQLDGTPATDIIGSTDACNEEMSSDRVTKSESEVFTMFADELEEGVEISESRVNLTASGELTPSPVHDTVTDGRSSPDRKDKESLPDGKISSLKMSDSSDHPSSAPHVISDPSICTAKQPLPPISCYKESSIPVDPVHASSLQKDDTNPAVKTKLVPAVTIPFQMSPTPATITTTHTVQGTTSRATDTQQVGASVYDYNTSQLYAVVSMLFWYLQPTEAENETSEGMKVLCKITNRVWFPRITADLTTEKEKICDKIGKCMYFLISLVC